MSISDRFEILLYFVNIFNNFVIYNTFSNYNNNNNDDNDNNNNNNEKRKCQFETRSWELKLC